MTHAASLASAPAGGGATYAFTDHDFQIIANRAQQDFGLHLTLAKKDLAYSRLTKRLRALGLADFSSYCLLIQAEDGADERMQMLSALTTNVTHFFREDHHFRTLKEQVLPPLIAAARTGGRLRLWSAGCSAGQEPYSLAFTLLGLCPEASKLDIRILATDVDPVIIAKAKAAIYDNEELKSLPDTAKALHITDMGGGRFAIGAKARELISFAELNLMQDWPIKGPFDVIFCRNVAIYFDKDTQSRLWSRLAGLLPAGGYLCIGHSERVAGPATASLETVGVTTYRKSQAGTADRTTKPKEGLSR